MGTSGIGSVGWVHWTRWTALQVGEPACASALSLFRQGVRDAVAAEPTARQTYPSALTAAQIMQQMIRGSASAQSSLNLLRELAGGIDAMA